MNGDGTLQPTNGRMKDSATAAVIAAVDDRAGGLTLAGRLSRSVIARAEIIFLKEERAQGRIKKVGKTAVESDALCSLSSHRSTAIIPERHVQS